MEAPLAIESARSKGAIPARNRAEGVDARGVRLLQQAAQQISERAYAAAGETLAPLTGRYPHHPEVMRLRAIVAHMDKRYAEAERLLRQALAAWPDDPLILNNLGSALGETDKLDEALDAFRRVCDIEPDNVTAWFNLGKALEKQWYPDESMAALTKALEIDPEHVQSRVLIGQNLRTLGRTEEAAAEYRRALAKDPNCMPALAGLANLKTAPISAAETAALARLYMGPGLSEEERANTGFALTVALEKQGRYREAFALLSQANAARRRQLKWNAGEFARYNAENERVFAKPIATAAPPGQGHEVIFVTSMPRSGSTLTETILAAHPDVEGGNELFTLPNLIDAESRRHGMPFPFWVKDARPEDWDRMGRSYLEQTRRWREKKPRFTDKALSNWQFAGAIRAMLPGARIVNCRRDPVETCLSCFRQAFGHGQAYTYDMNELAAFWRTFDRTSKFWRQVIPEYFLELVYEELVADPEPQIRRLLDFCGLEFDERCLRFHESGRMVRTASASQVREPIRKDTARAGRYGELLGPLRRALGVS